MINLIYDFVFGSGFVSFIRNFGFDNSGNYAYSFQAVAQLECILIAVFFLVIFINFLTEVFFSGKNRKIR